MQISDLHFGVPSAEDGAPPPTAWRYWSRFDGFLGHHLDALSHLTSFMQDIRRLEGEVHVVVTGDLTAVGKAAEFDLATKFLESSISTRSGPMGLGVPDALSRSIPGNHDRWPGSRKILGSPVALDGTFPVRPMTPVSLSLPQGRRLLLLGINSDEDVKHAGLDRLAGRGVFASQVKALAQQLRQPRRDEIRVLMVHHSLAHRGAILGIDDDSRRMLMTILARAGVSALLTGHLHTPLCKVIELSHRGKTWPLLEARCGTTTQIDEIPLEWVNAGTDSPNRLPENTLIVHRLFDTGSQVEWECELYARLHFGFEPKRDLPDFTSEPIVVWPR